MSRARLLGRFAVARLSLTGIAGVVLAGCLALGCPAGALATASPSGVDGAVSQAAAGPPSEVVTEPAEVTATGVRLKGRLNPDGLPTTYYFEYLGSSDVECLDIELGLEDCWPTTASVGPVDGDTQREAPPVEVTGLVVGETYRYELVAQNADGTVRGGVVSFANATGGKPIEVVTEPAEVTATGIRLRGRLNPDGLPTIYYFIYKDEGTECEDEFGCGPETLRVGPIDGDTQQEVPAVEVRGLTADRQYRFWLIAENSQGIARGAELFFTARSPKPPGGPDGGQRQEPKPPGGPDAGQQPQPPPPGGSNGQQPGLQSTLLAPRSEPPLLVHLPPAKAQRLALALRVCASKPRKRRASCVRQAHRRYGTAVGAAKRATAGRAGK